jgi:polyisoprenyl-phosphate glycosyltransferase
MNSQLTNKNSEYRQRVITAFHSMKVYTSYPEAINNSVSLPDKKGLLVPVCKLHADDEILIEKLAAWRAENSFAYPTQFKVTTEGTKKWLRERVLDTEDRILFLVVDQKGYVVGHIGLANALNDNEDIEVDNVLRGEKNLQFGIMTLAMHALIQWVIDVIQPKRIFLRVFSDNTRAISFYHRIGFADEFLQPLTLVQSQDSVSYLPAPEGTKAVEKYFLHMTYSVFERISKRNELISIVIPAKNEEQNIAMLEKSVIEVVDLLPYKFEFIVIDNRSTDFTGNLVKEICNRDKRWKYVRFSRDFTVEGSITAGYHYAKGDAIIVLYSDLQDPPTVIPRFLEKWKEGFDVVYGVRTVRRGDPAWRNFMAKLAYRIINVMAEVNIPVDAGDFRLIDRKVRDALESFNESNRYMRGLISWLGFRQTSVIYERQPRLGGVSKGPFWHVLFYTLNAITSFSIQPLRAFLFAGGVLTILSFAAIILNVILYFIGKPVPGLTTIFVLSFFAIGINSFGIGLLGEYIGRTYFETKRRPNYIVDELVGFEE